MLLLLLGGCAQNPLVLQNQVQTLQQQHQSLTAQAELYQRQAQELNENNEQLQALLAQARQRSQVLDDQLTALRDQLGSVTGQLARLREEKAATEQRVEALTASLQRRGGVTITPNNSFQQSLPAIDLPDVHVRRDGDLVRIELPGDHLFDPGGAQLRSNGANLLTTVAGELVRSYPSQIIGVEGHLDHDATLGRPPMQAQQLSLARATAVYEVLVTQARIDPRQLVVAGHGANRPVASNATPAGRQRNRRVELVIYPDRAASSR